MASSSSSSPNLLLPFLLVSAVLLLPFISCSKLAVDGQTHIEHGVGKVFKLNRYEFSKAINKLMDLLKKKVPRMKNKSGEIKIVFYKDGSKIKGKGECDSNLDEDSCRSCLSGIKNSVMGICMFYWDCKAINGRCKLGYSNLKN